MAVGSTPFELGFVFFERLGPRIATLPAIRRDMNHEVRLDAKTLEQPSDKDTFDKYWPIKVKPRINNVS